MTGRRARRGAGLRWMLVAALVVLVFAPAQAGAATFTVNQGGEPGDPVCDVESCTLYEAVLSANASPGVDTIAFAVGLGGQQTLDLTPPPPTITEAVHIDGTTQPGYDPATRLPLIELSSTNWATMLDFEAPGASSVTGLTIGVGAYGIHASGPGDITVTYNHIGTDAAGLAAGAGTGTGAALYNEGSTLVHGNVFSGAIDANLSVGDGDVVITDNVIGLNRLGNDIAADGMAPYGIAVQSTGAGDTLAISGNVIGANDTGIFMSHNAAPEELRIERNLIGLDRTGTAARPNTVGLEIRGAAGSAEISDNTISGNDDDGLRIVGGGMGGIWASGEITGNRIGTRSDGTGAIPNTKAGIGVDALDDTTVLRDNVVAGGLFGIVADSGTQISRNEIRDNTGLGIDLLGDGPTPNDFEHDGLQNHPIVTSVAGDTVRFTLESSPNQTHTIEAFASAVCDPSGYGEGATYLGSAVLTVDNAGQGSGELEIPRLTGGVVTLTATSAAFGTSEFSACVTGAGAGAGAGADAHADADAGGHADADAGGHATPTPTPTPIAVATRQVPPPPVVGESVNVAPVSGTVMIRVPGTGEFRALGAGEQLPVGTLVDVTAGRISLTSAKDASGRTESADFYGGQFKITQTSGRNPITELRLAGELDCTRGARAAGKTKKKKPKANSLWGEGRGSFRTRGRYGSAAVRGTKWLTRDQCDGTYFKVAQGAVAVRDFKRAKTILLRAGKTYFARAARG